MSLLLSLLPFAIASFASDIRNTTLVQEVTEAGPYLRIAPEYGTVYQGDGISVAILSTELQSFELPRRASIAPIPRLYFTCRAGLVRSGPRAFAPAKSGWWSGPDCIPRICPGVDEVLPRRKVYPKLGLKSLQECRDTFEF